MGYMVELNTLLRPPGGFNFSTLEIGKIYTVTLQKERAFPLHIAILVIDADWNFYGYAVAHSTVVKNQETDVTFEMLSLFSKEEKELYKNKFIQAGRKTGEVK